MNAEMLYQTMRQAFEKSLERFVKPRRPEGTIGASGGWGANAWITAGPQVFPPTSPLFVPYAQRQLKLSADFPQADIHTVQVGMTAGGVYLPTVPQPPYAPQAIVEWSINGTTITRQFDVGQGAQISAPMEAVCVIIVDATLLLNQDGRAYQVYANVSPRTRPYTGQPLTLTSPPVPITPPGGGGGHGLIHVPENVGARGVSLLIAPAVAGVSVACMVSFLASGSIHHAPTLVGSFVYSGQGPVPLPNGCNVLQIDNLSTFLVIATAIWSIDG